MITGMHLMLALVIAIACPLVTAFTSRIFTESAPAAISAASSERATSRAQTRHAGGTSRATRWL